MEMVRKLNQKAGTKGQSEEGILQMYSSWPRNHYGMFLHITR